jgi:CBS domain containing-hemolysin-like protein
MEHKENTSDDPSPPNGSIEQSTEGEPSTNGAEIKVSNGIEQGNSNGVSLQHTEKKTPKPWWRRLIKSKAETDIREAIEEFIEEAEKLETSESNGSISLHERSLLSNILELRDQTVVDIMIPRVDIVAIDTNCTQEELFSLLANKQNSRIPVYKGTLDDVLGTIHIKDILSTLAQGKDIVIDDIIRDVPIVSPSMQVLDLLLMFRQIRKHMALVVDEYGGIDGLITIGDVIEAIVGEIDDEYDDAEHPGVRENQDGSLYADSRVNVDDFEASYGMFLSDEEREDIDTLGGLVFSIAGRIPARGEIITHPSGMIFEILEAGPRRVSKLLIRNVTPT